MAVSLGQIVIERDPLANERYIYFPLGVAKQYVRQRLRTAARHGAFWDDTLHCMAGAPVGECYPGETLLPAAGAPNPDPGSWTSDTSLTMARRYTTSTGDTLTFTKSITATHARFMFRPQTGAGPTIQTQILTAADAVLATYTLAAGSRTWDYATWSPWYALGATGTKIKVQATAIPASSLQLYGVQFINAGAGAQVDPDTAGSMFFDCGCENPDISLYTNGNTQVVCFGPDASVEMACFWRDSSGAGIDLNIGWGGIGHKAVDTVTETWQSQTANNDWVSWAPAAGAKLACDALRCLLSNGKVYKSQGGVQCGTFAGSLYADANGWRVHHQCTLTVAMWVWWWLGLQVPVPLAYRYVRFAPFAGLVKMPAAAGQSVFAAGNCTHAQLTGSPGKVTITAHKFQNTYQRLYSAATQKTHTYRDPNLWQKLYMPVIDQQGGGSSIPFAIGDVIENRFAVSFVHDSLELRFPEWY